MPGCIVSATTASFRSVEKRRRRAAPVITSTFENVSDIGVCLGLYLGPPAKAGVRSKRGAVHLDCRWLVSPLVATAGTLVTVVEQGAHERLIEGFRQLFRKVRADVGQVEADVVPLRPRVHLQHVVVPTHRDHGGDGATRDAHGATFNSRPFRVEPAISDYVGSCGDNLLAPA